LTTKIGVFLFGSLFLCFYSNMPDFGHFKVIFSVIFPIPFVFALPALGRRYRLLRGSGGEGTEKKKEVTDLGVS
jgi:hypothetical protein